MGTPTRNKKSSKTSTTFFFNPDEDVRKSFDLKHWFGKRVKIRGKYGKITGASLDINGNFINWIVKMPWSTCSKWKTTRVSLKDPIYDYNESMKLKYIPGHLWREKN